MLIDNLFLSVGAMKAGTTWLYSVLDRHPDIYFSPEKEIHFFAHGNANQHPLALPARYERFKTFANRFNPQRQNPAVFRQRLLWYGNYLNEPVDDSWYVNLFAFRGRHKYCADFSNLHCQIDKAGWDHVKAVARNYRVLYVLRDPLQRLWSHIRFHTHITKKFEEIESWEADDYLTFASQSFIKPNGEYAKAVKRLRANVPETHLKVSFFEDMHSDQRQWLHDLESFLGIRHIDYKDELLNRRINEGPSMKMPGFFPELFENYVRDETRQLRALGIDPGGRWAVSA